MSKHATQWIIAQRADTYGRRYSTHSSNLANLVKNYHEINEELHFIAQKQTELQNELYDE